MPPPPPGPGLGPSPGAGPVMALAHAPGLGPGPPSPGPGPGPGPGPSPGPSMWRPATATATWQWRRRRAHMHALRSARRLSPARARRTSCHPRRAPPRPARHAGRTCGGLTPPRPPAMMLDLAVTPQERRRELAPLKTPEVCADCDGGRRRCKQCHFRMWCTNNMQIASMGAGMKGRWVDFDPEDNTVFCRVCLDFGTLQFKSNVCIRNLSHTLKRHA